MDFDIFWLLAAFGGGAFGAAIGGQNAFAFTGITYLVGLGGYLGGHDAGEFFNAVVFGPVFGPHIAFVGGAVAAAYAAWKHNKIVTGRDIATPLAGLGKNDVYIVGGLAGMVGYTLNQFLAWILPTISSNPDLNYGNDAYGSTDTVAFTIIIIAIVTRYAFGSTGMFSTKDHALMAVGDGKHWVEHQEKWSVTANLGFFTGILSAFASLTLVINFGEATGYAIQNHAQLIGWAIGAVSLLMLTFGANAPVTHHMTLIASIAALKFAPILAGHSNAPEWGTGVLVGALLIGALFGMLSALLGEVLSRATNANGDTHIDPPAFAIFPMTTVVYALAALIG